MLIVVESGSTKADWMIIDGPERKVLQTKGFNPYFHSEQFILTELEKEEELEAIADKVEHISFYGAGCSAPALNKIIYGALGVFFKQAEVHVGHDLTACAKALYEDEAEIECILGTGSNSCYFDGTKLYEEVPALGYVLGDEGSGSYFGKQVLAGYMYGILPEAQMEELRTTGLDKAAITQNVYQSQHANVYIASYMPYVIKYKDHPYWQPIIEEGLRKFVRTHVKCYREHREVEVNFTGSVAALLETELRKVCEEENIRVGRIVRKPLERLVEYELKEIRNKAS